VFPRTAGAAFVLALTLAACTTQEPVSSPRGRPAPAATGSILALTQDASAPGLVRMAVGRGSVEPVGSMPRDPAAAAAAPGPDGLTAVAVTRSGVARAYVIDPSSGPRPVGPPLRIAPDQEHVSVSASASRVLVADCDRVRVLDVTRPTKGWTDVGVGCWATLSPDGSRVATSPDGRRIVAVPFEGRHIVAVPLDAGRVRPLADLAAVAGAGPSARLFGAPAWGPQGLAFAATEGNQAAVYVKPPDRPAVVVVRERLEKTVRPPLLAWQRGGRLLAIMDDLGTGGALRVFDPSNADPSNAERVIALDALGFEGLLWSPDGSSLATMTSADALLVVGTDARWRTRVETTWNWLLAWTAAA
jgi:hypothetical protein